MPPRRLLVATLSLVVALPLPPAAGLPAPDDAWPRYAHDAALTGRTALRGDIATPREAWSISLAGEEVLVELRPEAGDHAVDLPRQAEAISSPTVRLPGPPLRDLDGKGTLRPAVESYHERWADVLPDVPGIERVAWDQTWTTSKICHLELFAHDAGLDKPRRLWRSEPEGDVFMPLCIVHDVDRDGVEEIVVVLHYRVMIYEGTTGRKETEIRFHSSRSYGWSGLVDVDGDPELEVVVLADFQSHFDVLDLDPAKPEGDRLSVKWRRDIEQAIEDRTKWPQVGPRPLADMTGGPAPEIAINFFNDTGDDEWHVVVLDAATGRALADLPRRYLHGIADLDGDGRAEILCAATNGGLVPDLGRVEVVRLASGEPSVVWSLEDAGFETADLPGLGPTWSTGASLGLRHALLAGSGPRPAVLVRKLDRDEPPARSGDSVGAGKRALMAVRHDDQAGFRTLWEARGFPEATSALAFEPAGAGAAALVRARLGRGQSARIAARDARPVPVGRSRLGTAPFAPVAARPAPGKPMIVLAEGAAEAIFAIRPPLDGRPAEVLWERPGRGDGDGARELGVVAADLDGDGTVEVLAAGHGPNGCAAISVYRADGAVSWRRLFERVPGAKPVHNVGALTYFWPGRFRSGTALDLFVNTRRGLMHSDVGHLLDGRTGETVWTREKAIAPGEFQWGYAGMPLAVADVTGDGIDEIVNLYPVCYWAASGSNGELVRARELASRKALPAWAAYGEPIVHDFTGDGRADVLLDSPYLLAVIDADGKPVWHGKAKRDYPSGNEEDNAGETTSTRHALIDFDGDGRIEVASAGYRDGVRAIDPRDGKILWSLEAPSPTCGKCAAADIDGKPGDELIYAAGKDIVAVTAAGGTARILWRYEGPAAFSLPAIADTDGDGLAEIIVQSADGVVRVIDGPGR